MHDIRAIRANATAFDAALARRGLPSASSEILARAQALNPGRIEILHDPR